MLNPATRLRMEDMWLCGSSAVYDQIRKGKTFYAIIFACLDRTQRGNAKGVLLGPCLLSNPRAKNATK
jgi:hypothetical protein